MKKIKHTSSIVEYQDFLTPEACDILIKYFNTDDSMWMDTCFYNSSVMNLLDPLSKYSGHAINEEYFKTLRQELWALAEDASGNRLNNLTFSAARWIPGAYADPHSDNSELDGTPNAWQDNKFVTIIYLNDNYDGGDLVFDYHGIKISPSTGTVVAFDPGIINVHSVSKIIAGDRYTMLASWDYASIEYTEEQLEAIRIEKESMKPLQQKQREEWRRSNNAMGD